jgi:hypothetical protein
MTSNRRMHHGVAEIWAAEHLLPECTFHHIRGDANTVAHELAQRALRHNEFGAPEWVCTFRSRGRSGW